MNTFGRSDWLISAAVVVGVMGVAPQASAAEEISVITTGSGSALEWPLYIATEKGYFAEHDVTIDLAAAPSASAAVQQVTAGAGDLAVGGVVDPIRAIEKGAGITIFMLETKVGPYSIWGKKELTGMGDLKGKLITVGGANDITRIYFDRMAAANGLGEGDYDLTFAGTTPARYAALTAGAVDAAILYPPASFKAGEEGYAHLGELADYVDDLPFTGYSVNLEWANEHADALKGFVQAMNQGVAWFYDEANREEAIDILVEASGADRGDIEKTYDYYQELRIYPEKATMTTDTLATIVKVLEAGGDLPEGTDPARFIDPSVNALLQ